MKAARFIAVCAGALAFAGCDDEGEVTLAPVVPLAYTRFVHAVADTSGTDWRFIDQLENSPDWFNLTYRQFTSYRATGPGARRLRVFPRSTDINQTSAHLIDTTLTFNANTYYTIVHVGYARTGSTPADHIVLIEDPIPTIAANQVAIRAMNLGCAAPAVDVFQTATASSSLPASPAFGDLAFEEVSAYQLQDTAAFAFQATPAGQTTPVLAAAAAPTGTAGDPSLGQTTIGGARMGGSALLGICTPGSAVGSTAPQTGTFVVQSSTGSLSATATGYARASGSFITDGFMVGQTITASGFTNAANNGTSVISAVAATALTVTKAGGTVVEASASGRTLIGPPRPAWVYLIDKHPR